MKDMLSVTITVDFARANHGPESGWEATVGDGNDYGPSYESGDVGVLLARVAADLRSEVEGVTPPPSPKL